MTQQVPSTASNLQIVVVGNQKGGSGKTTIAVHIAIALMRAGVSVAAVDLDLQQKSLTRYLLNRLMWLKETGKDLPVPDLVAIADEGAFPDASGARDRLVDMVHKVSERHQFLVIDTPGYDEQMMRIVHGLADTVVTPLNDSFLDLDLLGRPGGPEHESVGSYARIVEHGRRERMATGRPGSDWIVLRNRLSAVNTRNKRSVGDALAVLSQELDFRCLEGLAERMVFREFYPKGLTALDALDQATLGVRPTMSHLSAQMEVQDLVTAILARPSREEKLRAADAA